MISRVITACCCTFWTSTIGEAPVTVIVSSTVPTCSWPLMFAVASPDSTIPSRTKVLKPGRVKVTV